MKIFDFKPQDRNFSPDVVSALACGKDGALLRFEKGEYHFYNEGCDKRYFAPSNNSNGVKTVAFPIYGCDGVTIDGQGSTFVFHGTVFPFIISNSKNIVIKNIESTMAEMPYLLMKIEKTEDDGFYMRMHPNTHYKVDDCGHLLFLDAYGNVTVTSQKCPFSLHSLDRIKIHYLFTGSNEARKDNLATTYHATVAQDQGNGLVYFKYMDDDRAVKCQHAVGENIGILIYGRSRDVFFFEDSENISLDHVDIRRGNGMGVIAQCCENITVNAMRIFPYEGEFSPLTADALHFVNCTGKLDIRGCDVRNTMDDMLNVHGNYADVKEVEKDRIKVKLGHHEQYGFLPYKNGDHLRVIDRQTLDIKGEFSVTGYVFCNEELSEAWVNCKAGADLSFVRDGDLIENAERMPKLVEFVGNKGYDIPRVLLAGGKRYRYANNELYGFTCAMKVEDVPGYWYESGRCEDVVMENNLLVANERFGDAPAVRIGVSGYTKGGAPKVHGKIVIRNNVFKNVKNIITADGVKELVVEKNITE